MNSAQFKSKTSPGLFTRLKYKVMNLTGPLWRPFRRSKRQVLIEALFVAIPAEAWEPVPVGRPSATNSDGTLAWILSPQELADFQKFVRDTPVVAVLGRPRIVTVDGVQAAVFSGNVTGGGTGVDVTANAVSHGFKLLVKARATEPVQLAPGQTTSLKTNLDAACRVILTNGGALVLMANAKQQSLTNHWLILSSTAIDARGNPIKPQPFRNAVVIQRKDAN